MAKEITTEKQALAAVEKDCMALQYVPEELRTEKICNKAMKKPYRNF